MKNRTKTGRFFCRHIWSMVFVMPMLLFILSFTLSPIVQTISMGFQVSGGNWGLGNFQYIFKKNVFYEALGNTLCLTALSLTLQILLGFLIALILKQTFVGKGIARAIVLLPMGVPTLVSGVAMLYIFSTSGYLNELFYRLNISAVPIDWTYSRFSSMIVVAVADCWKVLPMVVLLILSGLESIPGELLEAADVDGATKRQRFWHITLPQLKSTMTMTIMIRMVDLLKIFEMPQVLLGRNTPFLGTLAYDEYKYGNFSYSAVVSTVLLVVIILAVTLYMAVFNREKGA